jgi:hypothetical protein
MIHSKTTLVLNQPVVDTTRVQEMGHHGCFPKLDANRAIQEQQYLQLTGT